MEASFRTLFSRDRTSHTGNRRLRFKTQSYESAVAQKAPVRGTYPVAGNGPSPLESTRGKLHGVRPSMESVAAAAPVVARLRPQKHSYSFAERPQTAPHGSFPPAKFDFDGRTRSGFSTRAAPNFSRKSSSVRSIKAFASTPRSPTGSASVDLLDAVLPINPSLEILKQRTEASGRRDYGEDVADRNIADFGGADLSSPQFSHTRHVQADKSSNAAGLCSARKHETRNDFAWREGLELAGDGAGDDISHQHGHARDNTNPVQSSTNAVQASIHNTTPTTNTLPARPDSNANSHTDSPRGRAFSNQSSPNSIFHGATVNPFSRRNSLTTTKSYVSPRGGKDTTSLSEPRQAACESKRTSTVQDPSTSKQGIALTATPEALSSPDKRGVRGQMKMYTPALPLPTSGFVTQPTPPTPPISPTASESPTSSIPRASLKGELQSPPRTRPRVQSASYVVFPVQETAGHKSRGRQVPFTPSDNGNFAVRPGVNKRAGMIFKGASKASSPEGIVDPSSITNTEVVTHQLPAVVHEYVTPRSHHIAEERVTCEIHNNDVFQRIQPTIEIQVSPTEHYIPSPSGDGLVEVHASAIPGRHTNWQVTPVETSSPNSATITSDLCATSTSDRPVPFGNRESILASGRKSMSREGIPREENVWQHPPQHETGAWKTGQTVPLHFYHADGNATDAYANQSNQREVAGDDGEELLYKESQQDFGGRLPGLEERNPVFVGVSAFAINRSGTGIPSRQIEDGEGKAAKALRRQKGERQLRQAGVMRMAKMSVTE